MSKVAIKGNASGTGTFTLEAPNSNTDRTLTLPDEAGTVITSGSYVAGITEADQWRLNTSITKTSGQFLDLAWERNDTSFDYIGSGVSESSGVFTFPSTGIWLLISQTTGGTNGSSTFTGHRQFLSTDGGSSFATAAANWGSTYQNNAYHQVTLLAMYDVTNTSNFQVKLECSSNATSVTYDGSTTQMLTGITFLKLGET